MPVLAAADIRVPRLIACFAMGKLVILSCLGLKDQTVFSSSLHLQILASLHLQGEHRDSQPTG